MENPNSLIFEMAVSNNLRRMTPEQRKCIISSIEAEELLEQEALKQNPNLNLERQMKQVLAELKDLRQELNMYKQINTVLPNTSVLINKEECFVGKCPFLFDTTVKCLDDDIDTLDDSNSCSIFSIDWLPMWIFFILLLVSLLPSTKPHRILL